MDNGMKALDKQVGGKHYKNFPIQPIEYSHKNKLGFIQGDIIKRITRYNVEGGKGLQDLEKIKHEIDILIEMEYSNVEKLNTHEGSSIPINTNSKPSTNHQEALKKIRTEVAKYAVVPESIKNSFKVSTQTSSGKLIIKKKTSSKHTRN